MVNNTNIPTYEEFFRPGKARDTTSVSSATGRGVALVVSDVNDPVPAPVLIRATKGVVGNLNVAGAASFRDDAMRRAMYDLVVRLFGGDASMPFRLNRIAIGSGGTRVLEAPGVYTGTMTAVETPGLAFTIAKTYSDNPDDWPRTWGHAPRTHETLGYGGKESSFQLAEEMDKNTIPNPLLHLLWLLQKGASTPLGWNGDLVKYIELLTLYRDSGEGESGLLVLSGGEVTAEEVLMALRDGIPVLGAIGTGRAADALVYLKNGNLDMIKEVSIRRHYQTILDEGLDRGLIELFDTSRPDDGQRWLQDMGFGVIL